MAKKKGLGASFRQQVEKVPVVQQKAPRTISTNVSTNTSNTGGGLGASFKTATQKAEEERSARMRQGISSVVRASFKRQMSQPTTVQKSALKPLATNALAPVKNASTGFKMNVRRNLAPMKEIANYTRGQQQRYAPTPSMDVLPAQDRKTRINVDYGNKLRAGMPSTNTALMSWRSDPTQREREYRDKYGYTQKMEEALDRRLNENMLEAYYSPTTGEIKESENGRAFSAGHTDAWARENVEDTIRRQFGIEPDEETLAKIEAQRGTVNYGAGNMLGQTEQYLLTRGLLGAAGLVGNGTKAAKGVKGALKAMGVEEGIDQLASVPMNIIDALKADSTGETVDRFIRNQKYDLVFSGVMEFIPFFKNKSVREDIQKAFNLHTAAKKETNIAVKESLEKKVGDILGSVQEDIQREVDEIINAGYHAGDLGKAESYFNQASSNRGTGHYGTGTYFGGRRDMFEGSSAYGNRPEWEVDFDGYNLYKPSGFDQGVRVHDNLAVIDKRGAKGLLNDIELADNALYINKILDKAQEGVTPSNIKNKLSVVEDTAKKYLPEYRIDEIEQSARDAYEYELARATDENYLQNRENDIRRTLSEIYPEDEIDDAMILDLIESEEPPTLPNLDEFRLNYYVDELRKELEGRVPFGRTSLAENMENAKVAVKQLAQDLGVTEDEVLDAIRKSADKVEKEYPSVSQSSGRKDLDSEATLFMKNLGYEGVDVRGIEGLDNTQYGSVIYDLKPETARRQIKEGTPRGETRKPKVEQSTDKVEVPQEKVETTKVEQKVEQPRAEIPKEPIKTYTVKAPTDEELDRLVREQNKEIYNKMSTDELQAELRWLGKNPTVTKDAEGAAEMGIKEAMEPDEIADRVDVINEILAERGVKGTTNKGANPQPKSKVEEPKTAEKSEEPKAETASKEEVFVSEEQVDKVFNDAIRKRSYRFETLRAYPRSGDMRIIIGDRAYDERGFRRLIREDLERTKAQVNEAINARAAKLGKQKASVEEPKAETKPAKKAEQKAEPSSAWDEIENEVDNIPTKEPPNKLKSTKSAEKVPDGVERLDSETQEAIEKSKRMTQKEKEASKKAGDYPSGMPKEMNGQPLNKGFDSITRESADTSDAAALDIMESVTMGGEGRKVSKGVKETQKEAAARWANDTDTSLKKITAATEGLKDGAMPKGYETFQEYFADVKEGMKYYRKLQEEAGEGSDAYWKAVENEADIARGAAKVTSNMGAGFRQYQEILGASPKARVVIVQKEIKKIEKQFEKLLKGKEIKPLSPEVTKMLEEAKTPVQQAEALEQASIEIWSQIPASLKEKADQWRMTSMLLNPKTHIRNIFGNFLFRPAILIKDAFSTPGEKALIKAGKIDPEDATKAFVSRLNAKDRTYRDAAKKVWNEYQTIIRRSGGKYFDTVDSKGFLTSRPFEVGRFTAGKEDPNAVQRALDFLAKKNGDALEAEDAYFMRGKFVDSYAKILKARKLDPAKMTEEQLQSAIDDAAQEALRSTYRDASGLANAINKARNYKPDASAGKKLVGWAVDATLPFVKTPVNILRRAKDYSPVGFIEGAANLTKALSKGDSKAAVEALDRVASGLTGGGICALGLFLGQMGLLDSKLEDGSEGFYKQDLGYQNYSLKLGGDDGVSISLSWAAPLSIPLFTGVEYAKMRENDLSPKDWVKFVDVAGRIFDPTMEMSVMQGPMALLEAISDGENGGDKILKGGLSVGLNYVGQYYPTISGQVARTVDPVRRNTSSTAESPTGRALEKWKNKQIAKTPFLSQTLEPYVNVWGEEQKTTDNALLRAAYEFGSPAYVNKIKADEVDKEIIRLNKAAASDDDKIIPSKYFSNAISFDGGKVSLDAKDLTMYNKIKGKASKEAIRKLIKTDEYKNANNDGKRELINNVMKNASTEAKQKTLISKGKDKWKVYTEGFTGGWEEQADAAKDAGIKAEQYYKYKTDKSVDLDENGGKSQYEVYTYLEGTDLTKSQKSALWNAYNKGWKNNPYAGGNIPEAPDPDDVKLKKAKKEAEILGKAKERQEGSLAAKAFKSSVMKRATETADLLEDSGNSKSGSSKRSRSRRRSGGGGGSSKARAKTESEKRFASLQKMQAPKTGKGIEALSKNAKGLTKAQKKALIKLMQKKLDV